MDDKKIAVVIPCYKVKNYILKVLEELPTFICKVYVVDDKCPDESGKYVEKNSLNSKVKVLYNEINLGVGGATKRGFKEAMHDDMDIVIKLDGDGQMDSSKIPVLINPIITNKADFTKGNRFFSPRMLSGMPLTRKLGNAGLSFLTKLSSGHWHIMDPTNGFIAIHASVLKLLELDKINNRFFFESDLLFRLRLVNALVEDVPIPAIYGDEKSNLKIFSALFNFSFMHINRLFKRIIYNYFIHDFNIGTIQLIFGTITFMWGLIFGITVWIQGILNNQVNETGTIMVAMIPLILGFQLLLSALNYDVSNQVKNPIHTKL